MHYGVPSTARGHRKSLRRLADAPSQADRRARSARGHDDTGRVKDNKEHARNISESEGAILQQREEVKRELLKQLPSDLEAMCKALPEFLRSAESDLEKAYPEELAIIRKRPLAKR